MKFIKPLVNQKIIKPVLVSALAMLSLIATSASTHAVEIKADQYQAFYGDINGDGLHDIYLAPKPKYIPIATDVMVIIPIAGDGNGYKLLAQASGYAAPDLDNNIDTNTLNAGYFQLLSGDFNGDGLADVFVQSTSQSLLSLTLANSLLDPPYTLQSFASFGRDTHELTIGDINNDGRDDITYTVNNQEQTLFASNQGHLTNDGQAQVTANYGYDYLNKRRYKVVEQIGEPRKEVLYIDDNTELRDGKLQKYITLGQKIARSDQAGGEFAPTEFYLNNHLGSIALTLDASAHVKNAFTYEPYGDKQIAYGETERSPYGFTGKEQDPETQLGYFHHRYLNTQFGQFITPDPVFVMDNRFTDPQLWSPYAYGRNNPIVYVDPDGGSPVSVLGKAMAKKGVKEGMQSHAEKKIFKRIERYMPKKNKGAMTKEFKEDLNKVMESFDQEWYETAFEFVPVAGDIYGGAKFAKQLKQAHDGLQDLENKWVGKLADILEGKEKDKFVKNMRRLGVTDRKKSEGLPSSSYKGMDGHHCDSVCKNKDMMTDPRNIEFMTKKQHIEYHKKFGVD